MRESGRGQSNGHTFFACQLKHLLVKLGKRGLHSLQFGRAKVRVREGKFERLVITENLAGQSVRIPGHQVRLPVVELSNKRPATILMRGFHLNGAAGEEQGGSCWHWVPSNIRESRYRGGRSRRYRTVRLGGRLCGFCGLSWLLHRHLCWHVRIARSTRLGCLCGSCGIARRSMGFCSHHVLLGGREGSLNLGHGLLLLLL